MSFEVHNPIGRMDAGLARQFESAVVTALGEERAEELVIRFGVWHGEEDGPRFHCKIEAAPQARLGAPPAWRWWSPLVQTPAELASHVREAMRGRRRTADEPAVAIEFWGWAAVGQAGA